jgi:hypothetical protein
MGKPQIEEGCGAEYSGQSSQTIHHAVNLNLKHITIIMCVAASGERVIPYVIRSQESEDLRKAPLADVSGKDRIQ